MSTHDDHGANAIRASRFTEFMLRENGLDRRRFQAWAFLPRMLFGAADKWWGDGGKRVIPHEGVEFCLFLDGLGRLSCLGEGMRIPAMYDGTVAAMIDDFLGTSIILEHRLPEWPPVPHYLRPRGRERSPAGRNSVREGDCRGGGRQS